MSRLVLIDGNAILHRAYHALPPLTAPDGSLVNAVYGFTSMLFKIFQDLAPSHIAVAFDRAAPTFRKELFKEYQAQRPKMEDELVGQVEKVHDVVRAFGVPIYEMDGYEADDVIGTIAEKEKSIDQIIIVTGDKDMLQLVEDERVLVYMPTKGLSEAKLYGEKEVVERLGVKPSQVVEFKALAGDPSDNYPGVEGIGPKTAADLLGKYGTVRGIYGRLEESMGKKSLGISETVAEKLRQGKESAELSRTLATIKTDAPIEESLDAMRVETLDTPEARKALEDFHFHSLLKRLTGEKKEKREKGSGTSAQQELF